MTSAWPIRSRLAALAWPLLLVLEVACGGARPQVRPEGSGRADGCPDGTWSPAALRGQAPYLPDFSYAGYRWGEKDIPTRDRATTVDVTRFGAIPNDGLDDTAAFQTALSAAHAVVGKVLVQVPAGSFHLREVLLIERSDITLRGQGPSQTRLLIDVPLAGARREPFLARHVDVYADSQGHGLSPYSWKWTFIAVRAPYLDALPDKSFGAAFGEELDATVVEELDASLAREGAEADEGGGAAPPRAPLDVGAMLGQRGGHVIHVKTAGDIKAGDLLRLSWHDEGNAGFFDHLFGGAQLEVGSSFRETRKALVVQDLTVKAVRGRDVEFREPLLHDVREWSRIGRAPPPLANVGIELLSIVFPGEPYAGHHRERGYNAIGLDGVSHSWIREVAVENADLPFLVEHSKNVTLTYIETRGRPGHYSCLIRSSWGVLVKNFTFFAPAIHSPSFNSFSWGNVYSSGIVFQAHLDQHMALNSQNLFDNIILIEKYRSSAAGVLSGGGNKDLHRPQSAAYNVFWNIKIHVIDTAARGGEPATLSLAPQTDAPQAVFVGLHGNLPLDLAYGPSPYVEGMNLVGVCPSSLYEFQRRSRLDSLSQAPGGAVPGMANPRAE